MSFFHISGKIRDIDIESLCEQYNNNQRNDTIEIRLDCRCLQKIFPHFKVKCLLFMGPTLGFDTKERNSFLIKFGVFFAIKTRFCQYYSYLIMIKSYFNDEFLVLLGPMISRFFACSNEEKKPKQQRVRALVLSI
jgi:hypothetical protein